MRRGVIVGLVVVLLVCGAMAVIVRSGSRPPRLSDVELAPLISAQGDLPAGYRLKDPFTPLQKAYLQLKIERPIATLSQMFSNPAEMEGLVTIFVYGDTTRRDTAYGILSQGLIIDGQSLDMLGEQARQSTTSLNTTDQYNLLFARCHTVVFMQGNALPMLKAPLLVDWAKKIDQRIQRSDLCQE
jgi:hypothetical protein